MSSSAPLADTGELTWREQKKLRTRQALHEAARRLVLADGLAAVTVEDICAEAGVSPRTFFNYFPSKAASALGLPDLVITDEQREAFLGSGANIVADLCVLVGAVFSVATGERLSDKAAMRELVQQRPELKPELFSRLAVIRRGFFEIAAERTDPERARHAATLVLAALSEAMDGDGDGGTDLGDRLRASVRGMCAVAAEPATPALPAQLAG
jgi:AcrR family transcriptional regulator